MMNYSDTICLLQNEQNKTGDSIEKYESGSGVRDKVGRYRYHELSLAIVALSNCAFSFCPDAIKEIKAL